MQSVSEFTFDAFKGALLPCPRCGKTMAETVSPDTLRVIYDEYARYHGEDTPVGRILDRQLKNPSICDSCLKAEEDAEREAARRCRVEYHRNNIFRSGLIREDAQNHTFDSSSNAFESANRSAWSDIRQWRMSDPNLWFVGPTGLGKTFAAHCLINKGIRAERSVAEISAIQIVKMANRFDALDQITPYLEADLMVIQDLDKGSWGQPALDLLWYIADERKPAQKVIITSNLSPEEIIKSWAQSAKNPSTLETLFRRLLPIKRIEFTGDYRKIVV